MVAKEWGLLFAGCPSGHNVFGQRASVNDLPADSSAVDSSANKHKRRFASFGASGRDDLEKVRLQEDEGMTNQDRESAQETALAGQAGTLAGGTAGAAGGTVAGGSSAGRSGCSAAASSGWS